MSDYEMKLVEAIESGTLQLASGCIQHINVFHDDWCALLNGGKDCNCDPIIEKAVR